ncbi:2-dehydropantoate 2-reductase [Aurantiacibacter xanthus]|uniref:2-dehydropantoate 2-reductase n=1 Tax=Aurantiacibacter xanthus TaxID=1784712 RepID=A0A3A1P5A0_9SPHN|nr:2-dehydropantoate 2-reductase [Aurantiacibacter xanthus]RIV82244.1 2-dehydropantoate 2-reductase [Aurantiacibacter xanthus]
MPEHDVAQRIVIVGAGAMGCLFAARLALAGNDVTLVDIDQARIATINERGLVLKDEAGTRPVALRAATADAVSGPVDLVIVFTKGNHTAAAISSVAHLAVGAPLALSLQNGLGNAEIIAETFGTERTLFGTAHIPADLSPPNVVSTHAPNSLALGGSGEVATAHARDVAALLANAGFEASASGDIRRTVWEKLAFNAALNAPAMIAQKTNGGLDNAPGLRIARGVISEAVAVAQSQGIALDAVKIDAAVCSALKDHAGHKASMFQDREAGRKSEIAMINGAIVREGERAGIATPVCSTLADLVHLIEDQPAPARKDGV